LGRLPRRLPPHWAWLGVVRDLHETLLSGVTGRQVNGVLAGFLLLINLTGMVVWWPGLRVWTRALTVDFARTWRRINFDLHRAIGFWTLAIVSLLGDFRRLLRMVARDAFARGADFASRLRNADGSSS